jgi:DNA-binding transcriptional MerR regulator
MTNMSGDLLRIGEFSRASWLSIKALRAYHESGLLVPAEIDATTGYRSYSVAQLTDAAIIRRLRQLDMPLEAIREVLAARDPAVTRKLLSEHGATLGERLAATQRAIDELSAALATPELHTPVHQRLEPARSVLTCGTTVSEDEWPSFLEHARELLDRAVAVSGAVALGPFGGCYPPLVEDDQQEVVAFLAVAEAPLLDRSTRAGGVTVGELPATSVAVMVHRGAYDDLEDTYRSLGAWVATHAQPADLPVRELYVRGPVETSDPTGFITEICWPIRSEQGD